MLVAIGMIHHHRESWFGQQQQLGNEPGDENEARETRWAFFRLQFIRRCIASGLIGLVGALLIADYFVIELATSVILVMLVILLLLPIFGLALWDGIAGRARYRTESNKVYEARQKLDAEAQQLMKKKHQLEREERKKQKLTDHSRDDKT